MADRRNSPNGSGGHSDAGVAWSLVRRSLALLLVAMAGMAWVFGKVVTLYLAADGGAWVSLGDMRSAAGSGTAAFGVAICLAGSVAMAGLAVFRSAGRTRLAGSAFLLAGGLSLVLWTMLLVEANLGMNLLGIR